MLTLKREEEKESLDNCWKQSAVSSSKLKYMAIKLHQFTINNKDGKYKIT